MEDFNEYIKNGGGTDNGKIDENTDLFKLVNSLATRFDGKSSGELLSAIYREAEKGKRNGTLSKNRYSFGFLYLLYNLPVDCEP